ncbi:MAG TPA: hypothetical protein VHS36_06870 [Candidatus Limnocylindrales bacterium]|jgi:hypothetical protein|nr:hypothetical protein [Candidatus Limnocylindrales bacterium]
MPIDRSRRLAIALSGALLLVVATATAAQAHVLKDFGAYSVALGWVTEPTYVGQVNAVQVVVKDKQGKAVTDLADGDLKVVVSVGGQQSAALELVNKFDPDTGLGVPGDYEAPITPTAPGDYTFHLTGAIHGQAVDETATSSDSTFNSAIEATDIQFPNKLPSLTEIATSLDRINARLSALPSAGASAAPAATADAGLADAVSAAQASATQARDAASSALLAGLLIGGLGVIIGVAALLVAVRRTRAA